MKAKPIQSTLIMTLALGATIAASVSHASNFTLQPVSSLSLTQAGLGRVSLTISNSGDQVWIIQGSSDLSTWSDVDSWKVHNGSFRGIFEQGDNPIGFYRAVYDPLRQMDTGASGDALLLPATPFNYAAPILPRSFFVQPILAQDNMPGNNVTTDPGATLGRSLFYDKRLSINQTISCSSCHQQAHGFSDPRRFSVGFDGSTGTRNGMGLSNARWYQRRHFFWDERANTLEDQVLMPIQNPIEMGMTLEALIASPPSHSTRTSLP